MSIYFPDISATFIHIPRTGGTSFERWVNENKITHINKDTHRKVDVSDKGLIFGFVRNPFDRMVSLFHYIGQNAERRLNALKTIKEIDGKFNTVIRKDLEIFRLYESGFSNWIENFTKGEGPDWAWRKDNQSSWFGDKDCLVLKTENLSVDFSHIQDLFNCYDPLPKTNISEHRDYHVYYNSDSKRIVERLFKDDLDKFNYGF